MIRTWAAIGAVSGALAVAAGAFGAHALGGRVEPRLLAAYETGARYHLAHSLALLAVAWAAARWSSPATTVAGWAFTVGIVLFAGSLYLMALTGVRALGAVTPVGGVALIGGWIALAVAAVAGR